MRLKVLGANRLVKEFATKDLSLYPVLSKFSSYICEHSILLVDSVYQKVLILPTFVSHLKMVIGRPVF